MPDLIIAQHWTNDEVREFCTDVLTIAAEGGINYWATFNTVRNPGGWVAALDDIWDGEEGEFLRESLTVEDIWATLSGLANRQYDHKVASRYLEWIRGDLAQKAACNIDAECADVIVQLAIFNEIVYG